MRYDDYEKRIAELENELGCQVKATAYYDDLAAECKDVTDKLEANLKLAQEALEQLNLEPAIRDLTVTLYNLGLSPRQVNNQTAGLVSRQVAIQDTLAALKERE